MKNRLLLGLALLSCSVILSNCGCCGEKKSEQTQEVKKEEVQMPQSASEVVVNAGEVKEAPQVEK